MSRQVISRPFRDYFRRAEAAPAWLIDPVWLPMPLGWFYRRRHYFQPFTWACFVLLCGLVLAWGHPAARVFVSTNLLFLAVLYLRTRQIAQGLYLARHAPKTAVEKNRIEVEIEIRNTSRFAISDLLIRDLLSGSMQSTITVSRGSRIEPLSIHVERYKTLCDAGMGPHRFGPLEAIVTDPLGIFEFVVRDSEISACEVLPESIPLQDFKTPASIESVASGVIEGNRSGQSTNFLGVREYRPGDPLRKIHWKLSAKHREVVVKEFENVINNELTICLEMDRFQHIGRKSLSTWEYAKDITLSLLQQKLSDVSRIQFLTEGLHVPFGGGSEHFSDLMHRISRLEPSTHGGGSHLLEQAWMNAPYGSSLLYIAPVYQISPERLGSLFEALQAKAVRVGCIFIPSAPFSEGVVVHPAAYARIAEQNKKSEKCLESLLVQNAALKITTYVVKLGDSIPKGLAVPRVGA